MLLFSFPNLCRQHYQSVLKALDLNRLRHTHRLILFYLSFLQFHHVISYLNLAKLIVRRIILLFSIIGLFFIFFER